jgi:hypothetical protein
MAQIKGLFCFCCFGHMENHKMAAEINVKAQEGIELFFLSHVIDLKLWSRDKANKRG